MMTPQQHADCALARWQEMRDLPPEQRIEALMADFFRPLPPCDVEFDIIMCQVTTEMAEC
jgi:hypothetical protein